MKKEVYLDNAATTKTDPRVLEVMLPYFSENYGNPSSMYKIGHEAKMVVDEAREKIAKTLGEVRPDEIIFTSGGTESDNMAILGAARKHKDKKKHIITSQIEHHAVLHPCEKLEKEGFEVTYLPVDRYGMVNPEGVKKFLREETVLVSVMYANNEIGTIKPISEIAEVIEEFRKENKTPFPYFHTDACQAAGYLSLDVNKLGVDMLTLNGSKIYGPKGIGILYLRTGVKIEPLVFGGGQEKNLRSGTENIAGIVGLAKALEIVDEEKEKETERLLRLAEKLKNGMLERIDKTFLNGHPEKRLPNNVNMTILDIEGEALILHLDEFGIYTSTGSACTSASLDPSHVILALGLPYEAAHGSLRFAMGRYTKEEDIDYVLEKLPEVVENLRKISPTRVDMRKIEKVLNERK